MSNYVAGIVPGQLGNSAPEWLPGVGTSQTAILLSASLIQDGSGASCRYPVDIHITTDPSIGSTRRMPSLQHALLTHRGLP